MLARCLNPVDLLSAAAKIVPDAPLALSVGKRPVRGRPEFVIHALSLSENVLQDAFVKIRRHIRDLQSFEYSASASQIGILQAQGMSGQASRTQQFAQPFPIPGRCGSVERMPRQDRDHPIGNLVKRRSFRHQLIA
jgi:hypothetical protein